MHYPPFASLTDAAAAEQAASTEATASALKPQPQPLA